MSVWKSDEKLLSICILNFSFKNDFVWEEISNIRHSVSSPDETPRSSSKILRCASYFQLSSRCFIWWWNTASHVWYITLTILTEILIQNYEKWREFHGVKKNNGVFIIHSKILVIRSFQPETFRFSYTDDHSSSFPERCLLTLLLSTQNSIDQRRVLDQSHLNIDKSMLVKDLFVFRCSSFLSSCGK